MPKPKHVTDTIVLCEDAQHRTFVRHLLRQAGVHRRRIRVLDLPSGRGSGEQFVRKRYANEVRVCRNRATRMLVMLVVVIDADTKSVERRLRQLDGELTEHELDKRGDDEPILILVPKRNIETWVRCLLCDEVDEGADYSRTSPSAEEIKRAALTMFEWSRPNARLPKQPVASLRRTLDEELKRLGPTI